MAQEQTQGNIQADRLGREFPGVKIAADGAFAIGAAVAWGRFHHDGTISFDRINPLLPGVGAEIFRRLASYASDDVTRPE